MKTRLSTDHKGMTNEAVNVELHGNGIKTVNPARNAVIVDFVEFEDEEGNKFTNRITTIECLNDNLYEEMKEYALKLNDWSMRS